MPQPRVSKKLKLNGSMMTYKTFYTNIKKKKVLIITRDWNAKVGSQEIPKVTSKFGLGVQNEAGQRLMRILPRERTGRSKHPLMSTLEMTLHMDITRWSIVKSD